MAVKKRRTSRFRTTYRKQTRRRRSVRQPLDLGPRPALTVAAWVGLGFGIGFLVYAVFGDSVWSERTLAAVPIGLALKVAGALILVSALVFLSMKYGWLEDEPRPRTRRTRRSTSTTTRRRRVRR